MVVEPLRPPVIHDHRKIKIVGGDSQSVAFSVILSFDARLNMSPRLNNVYSVLAQGNWRAARRTAQALLQTHCHDL